MKNSIKIFSILGAILLQLSCASTKRADRPGTDVTQQQPESESRENDMIRSITPLTVVLGPGLAKGYAHIGVLRALEKNRIPVGAIVGVEMGALVGSAYASAKSINQFEWLVFQVKENLFKDDGVGLSRLFGNTSSGDRLENSLRKIFSERRIESLKLPLRICLDVDGTPDGLASGDLWRGVRASLAMPGLVPPIEVDGRKMEATTRIYPVEVARMVAQSPVVVVDLISPNQIVSPRGSDSERKYFMSIQSSSQLGQAELEQADLVLNPQVSDIGFWDFSKKNSAMFAGEKIVQKHLDDLKGLAGIMGAEPQ